MGDEAFRAEGLVKRFKKTTALDGVDLVAAPGMVLGVLGPNGAGKSTAIRVLATLTAPDAGSARVGGFDVVRQAAEVRRRIGLTGQYATLDEELSGRANLTLIGRLLDLPKTTALTRADELLDRFDLVEAGKRPVSTYSGGMRRRLDLAASLVGNPAVVFLDEPSVGLDPGKREDLWRIIRGMVGDGATVLLTTQYLEEADALADAISVIDQGQVIAHGTPAELKRLTGGQTVTVHPTDAGRLDEAASILTRVTDSPVERASAHELRVRVDGDDAVADLTRRFAETGIAMNEFSLRLPSLDEVFVYLFGGAVSGSSSDYIQYIFPGIMVTGAGLSGMMSSGMALNIDMKKGVFDRFRSLPIARTAPLLGSILADVVRYVIAVAVLFAIGFLMGFRVETDAGSAFAAAALAILFGFSISWVTVFLGVILKDESTLMMFVFFAFMMLLFGTNLAAPIDTLPGWLQAWANINPVTHAMDAARGLLTGYPLGDSVMMTLLWSAIIFVLFCPLAVWAYARKR